MQSEKQFTLIGPDGKPYLSSVPGRFGGHRGSKIYGRMDCRAALQAIARGGYVKQRVFFPRRGLGHHRRLQALRRLHAGGVLGLEAGQGCSRKESNPE